MSTHRPFYAMFLAYSLGILLSKYFPAAPATFIWIGIFLNMAAFVLRKRIAGTIVLFLALFSLGAVSQKVSDFPDDNHISKVAKYYRHQNAHIRGVVISDVEQRAFFRTQKTVFTLGIRELETPWGWKPKAGKVLVNIFRPVELAYGDLIEIDGKLHPPYNFSVGSRFSYRDYLKQRGIQLIVSVKKSGTVSVIAHDRGNVLKSASLKIRDHLKDILNRYLPPDARGLTNALLLGERYDISQTTKNVFVQTGTAHILAISGFNVGIVAFLIFIFLKIFRVPDLWQYVLTICFVLFYAFLTGGQSPVVRSAIMTAIFLTGFILEREADPRNSLACAGLVILLFSPGQIYDVGFQLSFSSVFFILTFYPVLAKIFLKGREEGFNPVTQYLVQSFLVSLAASLGVTGLIAYYFKIITPISIVANLIIIPLSSLNIALGVGLLVFGLFWPYAATLFGLCIVFFLRLTIFTAYLLSKVPGAYFYLKGTEVWQVFVYYILLLFRFGVYWAIEVGVGNWFIFQKIYLFFRRFSAGKRLPPLD